MACSIIYCIIFYNFNMVNVAINQRNRFIRPKMLYSSRLCTFIPAIITLLDTNDTESWEMVVPDITINVYGKHQTTTNTSSTQREVLQWVHSLYPRFMHYTLGLLAGGERVKVKGNWETVSFLIFTHLFTMCVGSEEEIW